MKYRKQVPAIVIGLLILLALSCQRVTSALIEPTPTDTPVPEEPTPAPPTITITATLVVWTPTLTPVPWTSTPSLTPTITATIYAPYALANGSALGDPNAPVTFIEYSDFQCYWCGIYAAETQPRILETYVLTGQLYYEFHAFGALFGAQSQISAEAAFCAGDQNMFWQYHDRLFLDASVDFNNQGYLELAESLNLDMDEFEDCFFSQKYTNRVEQDRRDGMALGISGTPGFVINGKIIIGAQPFSFFREEIEAALAASD